MSHAMAYNADNQRFQKSASGMTTNFIWDDERFMADANSSDTVDLFADADYGFAVLVQLARRLERSPVAILLKKSGRTRVSHVPFLQSYVR